MIRRMISIYCFLLVACSSTMAQDDWQMQIAFDPLYQGATLVIDDEVDIELDSTDVIVDMFRCYISNIELIKNDLVLVQEKDSYHLLDAEEIETLSFTLDVEEGVTYDSIRFMIGVDSLTSVSGAMGGDLDPTKGMFWTWNTGYIFFKVEGISPICDTRKNRFVYHLGGYESQYAAQQWVTLPIMSNSEMKITIDIDEYIEKVDLIDMPNVMSPGKEAYKYAKIASSIFKISE